LSAIIVFISNIVLR